MFFFSIWNEMIQKTNENFWFFVLPVVTHKVNWIHISIEPLPFVLANANETVYQYIRAFLI